jgi:hypothetical protein
VLPCTAVRTPVTLFLVALFVRLGFLALFPDPAYPDSAYYADVAHALASGQGFNVNFIWIFAEVGGRLPANPHLPIPSNAHWMPLATLVQWPFLVLGANSQFIAGLPFALIGALAAPLTWAIAREAGARPAVAIGAGILAASPAASAVFFSQPDNFGLYQPLVAGALLLTTRALKRRRPWEFAFAGVLVGLATLARNDGVLVGATVGLAFLWDRWRVRRERRAAANPGAVAAATSGDAASAAEGTPGLVRRVAPTIPFWAAVACLTLFLVVVAPWFARQLSVFGSLLPSSQSGRVLFIRSIQEWNSITTPTTLDYLLGQGIGPLLWSRLGGLVAGIEIYSVLVCAVFLVPFVVIGAWLRRRSVDFGPFFVYAFILFAFTAIVSAVHVPGGTFIHSAVALAPHTYVLAMEGIVAAVAWIARRRRSWNVESAAKVFIGGAVALTVATSLVYGLVVIKGWDAVRDERVAVATELNTLGSPASDRLMSIDAGGYEYWTGHGGVVSPDDPIDTVRQVAQAYDIRWLILERSDIVRSLSPILKGGPRPAWIGAPVFTYQVPTTDPDLAGIPAAAIFPICFDPTDTRCAATAQTGPTPATGPTANSGPSDISGPTALSATRRAQ